MLSTIVTYHRQLSLAVNPDTCSDVDIKPFTLEQASLIYAWRNDPRTRLQSLDTDEIPYPDHYKWCQKKLNDERSVLLIGVDSQGRDIACIRYDFFSRQARVSIYLNPDFTGQGFGKKMLLKSIAYLQTRYPFDTIAAQVKSTNTASLKLFEACGFVTIKEGTDVIKIANRSIGSEYPPFIIAEMSGNHNQSLDKALAIVDAAADAGAHCIKLQTYTADTMTLNIDREDFVINDAKSLWNGRHLYELYEEAHTPWAWHAPIFERAKARGMLCFSTPFDETAVDFLEELNVPAYKIASFENTDIQLIKKVASTGKPIIISTGMASLEDLKLITDTLSAAGCKDYILLKCTSAYPAQASDANIRTIPHLAAMFACQVGLSDHTMGIGVPIAAVALGATVIEKHFCLDRADGGVDSSFSLEPQELKLLVQESERAWQSLGRVNYQQTSAEEKSKQFRRSIYFTKDMQAGELITEDCIRCVRPGYGLAPRYWAEAIGKKVVKNVEPGTRLSWSVMD